MGCQSNTGTQEPWRPRRHLLGLLSPRLLSPAGSPVPRPVPATTSAATAPAITAVSPSAKLAAPASTASSPGVASLLLAAAAVALDLVEAIVGIRGSSDGSLSQRGVRNLKTRAKALLGGAGDSKTNLGCGIGMVVSPRLRGSGGRLGRRRGLGLAGWGNGHPFLGRGETLIV